ncbi:HNH endonuclease [Nocardia gipuzkoensis]|uniref:HNH endonuclease n=1 Tax=Nocardia gipuzkoensis TaxID=2749991 RepID=UPI001E59E531|nr:HNH endonuclease [Nocardia gipuzkoensis]UGT65285.1 HNH endonuclease [Nocardia gipuzkoensis]
MTLTVDHVVPVALGGSDDPSNLAAACKDCNAGKTSTSPDAPLVADIDAKAVQWAKAMQIVAQGRAVERDEREQISDHLLDHWEGNRPNRWNSSDLPHDWMNSVMAFLEAGLELGDLEELMLIALNTRTATNKWRYFCGCCWTRIRQAQEHAARIVSQWEQDESEGDDEDYEVSEAEHIWASIAVQWRETTGTRLRLCICLEPCGKDECVMHVAGLAQGALIGIAEIAQYITKQESGPEPLIEEATDGA